MAFYTLIKVPRKIYLIFPNVGVVGVSVLFLRLSHAIAQKLDIQIIERELISFDQTWYR